MEAMDILLQAMYACVGRNVDECRLGADQYLLPHGIPPQLALPLYLVADRYDVKVSHAILPVMVSHLARRHTVIMHIRQLSAYYGLCRAFEILQSPRSSGI